MNKSHGIGTKPTGLQQLKAEILEDLSEYEMTLANIARQIKIS